MHERNKLWFQSCKDKYPEYFSGIDLKVVEFGSFNINGSIRTLFLANKYIGVDWRPQDKSVQVVGLAHEVKLDDKFDTIISASMLEHDPYWKESLKAMVGYMKEDGILFLSWGAANNIEHCLEEAPDGKFHPQPAQQIIKELESLGIFIQEFHYEGTLYPDVIHHRDGTGEVVLIGVKDKSIVKGDRQIEEFLIEDRI